jgi:hypothetical protein
VRLALALLLVTGCGRIGFDAIGASDDAPPDDGGAQVDAMLPFELACSETMTAPASPIAGIAFDAVATTNRLIVVWIDAAGALFATSWQASASGVEVVKDAISVDLGPFTRLWTAANGNELLVAAQGTAGTTAYFLHEDLFKTRDFISLGGNGFAGRNPITRKRGGPGFVAITIGGDDPAVFDLPSSVPPLVALLPGLRFHASPSIAADADGYSVVTELADQFGPGCWYSKVSDGFVLVSGPGSLESTQQADCDTSTIAASAGPAGAARGWMDRDPVNSYVEFRGSAGGSGTASMPGETGVGLPVVAATSTGFAVLYRSTAGVRVFDDAGRRTLAPPSALADLVTWADSALAVWTAPGGVTQLTRLCPVGAP